MALNFKSLCKSQFDKRVVGGAAILLAFTLFCQTYFVLPQGVAVIPLRIVQIILIWIASDILAIDYEPKWWIRISFFVYVIHSMVLESVEKAFWIAFGDTTIGAILDIVFAPLITLTIVYFLALILRKAPFVWGVLNGGRGA